jgi:hypothetical protein
VRTLRSSAGAAIALALATALAPTSVARADGIAACRIEPRVLDVAAAAGPLIVHLELRSAAGRPPVAPEAIEPGVYIASVAGVTLPAPGTGQEALEEDPAGRHVEDLLDAPGGAALPNGTRELVLRFSRPSDGNPETRHDGDAGDVLAMLMDLPDGAAAEICVGGAAGSRAFQCCDSVTVRNRGLRDLPRGLLPEATAGPR